MTFRKAKPSDTHAIHDLIDLYSAKGLLLPRSYSDIMEKIRDFSVATEWNALGDKIRGVAALHAVGEDLAEIRSLAVAEAFQGQGVGRKLVEYCLEDAGAYQTDFFEKLGFEKVEKTTLPQKIWGDCVHCAKFSDCDEIAMILNLKK